MTTRRYELYTAFQAGVQGKQGGMRILSYLEQAETLDQVVEAGQRVARRVRPGQVRDALHGVWLGHPLHPVLARYYSPGL